MRATGIVRRIDDLGRIVIPKEIRKNLGVKEGDPFEIFVDNEGGVIFKRYRPYDESDIDAVIRSLEQLDVEIPTQLLEMKQRLQDESK